jgi:serine/threonine protein kinase/tetratricopeptide (TPR) repeat protein
MSEARLAARMNLSADTWTTLSKLLDEALDLQPEARVTWLEQIAQDQPDLAPALRKLLAAHASDETVDVLRQLPALELPEMQEPETHSARLAAGARIGPYRLVRALGGGGMADVWLAERADGAFTRDVALKLPLVNRLRSDLAPRFARERDILARLEHPHIARLYDAGVTAEGLPYLAMEYVAGQPLTAYCDAYSLDIAARLRLFRQVLEAVQYAHANLVVHRDLKPSNILVTADGQARLLDFGIAKLLAQDETAQETQLTQLGGRALTPDYASPEQIKGEMLTIATDVYSLGVVLYELLTGHRPYRLKLESAAQLELAIIEAEATRPAAAVDAKAAAARGTSAKNLARTLSGDLETIVLKALAKEPAARYGTIAAFAEDLQRFSEGRAVLARPASFWYRTRKFIRRNRYAVTAAAVACVALLATTGISLWQARVARDQAEAAAREARRAEAVQNFVLDIFRANSDRQQNPARARNTTARELLDLGTERLQSALQDQPESRAEVMKTLSDMYYELELEEQSATIEGHRIALLRELYGPDDRRVAEALIAFAASLHATKRRDEILPALMEAKRILDVTGDNSSRLRGELLTRLAQRHQNVSLEKMRAYADDAVRILRAHQVADEDRMSTALHLAARARVQLGEYADGERLYRDSLEELRKSRPVPQVALLQGAVSLAECLTAEQKFEAALQTLREAGENARKSLGPDDAGALVADSRLAALLHAIGRRQEARRMHENALSRVLAIKGNDETLFTPIVRSDYGRSLFAEGQLQQADDQIARVVAIDRRHYPDSAVLGQVLRTLAAIATARGHYPEARQLFAEAAQSWSKGTGTGLHPSRNNRFLLDEARLDLALRDPARAIDRLGQVVAPLNAAALLMRNEEIERDILLARAYLQAGDTARALSLARGAREQVVTSRARDMFPALEAEASVQLAQAQIATGDAASARAYAERALALQRELSDPSSPWLAEAYLASAEALLAAGETRRAREYLARARLILAAQSEVGDQFRQPLLALARRIPK